jgi:predicted nuclease of predicted toxin-antitoxin system
MTTRRVSAYRLSDVGLKGVKDGVVAEYASNNTLILVTLDKDFGYYHKLYKGRLTVILLRVKPPKPVKLTETMNKLIREPDLSKAG